MNLLSRLIATATAATLVAPSAGAVCIHNGRLYAKTTLPQEFRESPWVARAKVVRVHEDWSGDPWVSYRLHIVHAYKGRLPRRPTFFTMRNSGAFYLGGKGPRERPGGEYLLFLVPSETAPDMPPQAKGTLFVNYACGQSKPWDEVTPDQKRLLTRLSGERVSALP